MVDIGCVLCNQLPVRRWADVVPALHFQDFKCICAESFFFFFCIFYYFLRFSEKEKIIKEIFIF